MGDGLYESARHLLLLTVEKQSALFYDQLHSILRISEVFLAVAKAPATHASTRAELQRHAHWLISGVGWLPTDEKAVDFIERWPFINGLFEFALACRKHEAVEACDDAVAILMRWTIQAGRLRNGYPLSRGSQALVALALASPGEAAAERLKVCLNAELAKPDGPEQQLRYSAARDLRELADRLRPHELEIKAVDIVLSAQDPVAAKRLLVEVADILSPETAGEPVRAI